MKRAIVLASFLLVSPVAAADQFVKVTPGTGGDLREFRLYSVDFECELDESHTADFSKAVIGFFATLTSSSTLNENVSIYSRNATAIPHDATPPPAPTGATANSADTVIFSTNVFTQSMAPLGQVADTKSDKCGGQFFINGSDVYRIEAQVGINTTNTTADVIARLATLAKTASASIYGLVRAAKPVEFDSYVDNSATILTDYNSFRNLFVVANQSAQTDKGDLRVGDNWVRTYDNNKNVVSSLLLRVRPVVSLVKDGHSKFLAAYKVAAADAAMIITGTDVELHQRCVQATQTYFESGIRQDYNVAYLLYRRLLSAFAAHEKIAQCLGLKLSRAALSILTVLPVSDAYRITQDDIDNLPHPVDSDQPHDRARLETEMHSFVNLLDRHLQSDGLRGSQLSKLLSDFTPKLNVEDTTTGYKVFDLMLPGQKIEKTSIGRDELLTSIRKAGLLRWLCVQRTKREATNAIPLYDPEIDSAVMVIAAKAGPNDQLDYNKSTYFGVHILFDKGKISEPLHINHLIFEDSLKDTLLKDNQTCMQNIPTANASQNSLMEAISVENMGTRSPVRQCILRVLCPSLVEIIPN